MDEKDSIYIFVDLGLPSGTLWANKNVGADHITDAGIYMSYPSTFFYKNKNYHIPTKEQFEELIKECTWKWTKKDGVYGYKVVGKNGKYIFLPTTGYYDGASLYDSGTYGYYWSTTYDNSSSSWRLDFYSLNVSTISYYRHYGMSIRLVTNSVYE